MKKIDMGTKKIFIFSLFVLVLVLGSSIVQACLTVTQVQNEKNLCLYIYKTNVYHYGTIASPHHHPCGSNITDIMPSGHARTPGTFLDPWLEDSVCVESICTPVCSGKQCGDNGCGGSCGTCNNNQTAVIANNTKEELTASPPSKTYWLIGRWTGMLAYLFLALSILGGVYRLSLIKRFGRNPVMLFHGIISYLALALVLTHIFGLLYDPYVWGEILTYHNSFLPSFANLDATYLSLGVISLYLMVLGVIGCIFFKSLIKGMGYKTWLWGHRLTIFAYIFVYIHAWKLGTDFSMPYHIASQTFFFFIIGKYAYDYFDRHHDMSHVEPFKTVETKKLDQDVIESISKIQFDRNLENQMVGLNGYILPNRAMYGLYWYYLYDDGTTHIGAYSSVPLPVGPHMMKGVLRFFKDKPYVEIREIIS